MISLRYSSRFAAAMIDCKQTLWERVIQQSYPELRRSVEISDWANDVISGRVAIGPSLQFLAGRTARKTSVRSINSISIPHLTRTFRWQKPKIVACFSERSSTSPPEWLSIVKYLSCLCLSSVGSMILTKPAISIRISWLWYLVQGSWQHCTSCLSSALVKVRMNWDRPWYQGSRKKRIGSVCVFKRLELCNGVILWRSEAFVREQPFW